jgi:hypothetical protein
LLSFNSNYSASQAALNEFEMYLEKEREKFGCQYCDFIYHDWFLSMVLLSKIDAGSYLSDIKNPLLWDKTRAWTMAEWAGQVKPTTNMLQRVKAYKEMIDAGLITRSLATREINGKKYSRIIRTLKKENGMLVEANAPITNAGQPTDSGTGEPVNNDAVKLETAKMFADAYGVGVRAGTTTPQTDDEKAFRELLGLPVMSDAVKRKWENEHGTRQPITLAREADNDDPENNKKPVDNTDTSEEV